MVRAVNGEAEQMREKLDFERFEPPAVGTEFIFHNEAETYKAIVVVSDSKAHTAIIERVE